MERIGITASKMAKGNIVLYNLYVIAIAFVLSLMLFLIAGSSIVLALILLGYVVNGLLPGEMEKDWFAIIRICMGWLTVVVSIVTLFAVGRNVKIR